MGYIKSILKEEYERLKALIQKYREEMSPLPKGSVTIKKRGSREYLYLTYRQDGKVKSQYIGAVDSGKAKTVLNQVELRRRYEEKLKAAIENLTEVEKAFYGRKL